jgi:CBS domain-containing protein
VNLPGFDTSTIDRLSSTEEYLQGRAYFEDGRVRNLVFADGVYKAYVHRIGHNIVRITPKDGDPEATCSCPWEGEGFCRHIVAVALMVLEGTPEEGFSLIGRTPAGPGGLEEALMQDLGIPEAVEPRATPPGTTPKAIHELCARDVMISPVQTLDESASLAEGWRFITEKRYRHVPVVAGGRLVGIVSDRDLLREAVRQALEPEKRNPGVADLMHSPVMTARPDTPIRQVARVMFEERVGSIPIVDARGALLGMITRSDLLRVLVERL